MNSGAIGDPIRRAQGGLSGAPPHHKRVTAPPCQSRCSSKSLKAAKEGRGSAGEERRRRMEEGEKSEEGCSRGCVASEGGVEMGWKVV